MLSLHACGLLFALLGPLPRPQEVPVPSPPGGLEAALGSVHTRHLRSDLEFLASDALAGRDTPSPGLTVASLFLRARLERLGLSPVEGQWFHWYDLRSRGLDEQGSYLRLGAGADAPRLRFGRDYYLNSSRDLVSHELCGPVVSVGTGTRAEFEGVDLGGAWALVHDPGRSMRRAQRHAREAGAIGVLATPAPDYRGKPYDEKFKSVSRVLSNPRMVFGEREVGEQDDLPLVLLMPAAAGELMALAANPFEGAFAPAGHGLGLELAESRRVALLETPVPNVCGFWPGKHPELAREVIVVSAHYDHVGTQGEDIFNGADDNGSGSTGLLAIAEALVAYGPLDRSVLLLWLSGEEKGLWGSNAWTQDPLLPNGSRAVADLNIDMIGRTGPEELYLTPTEEHPSFNALSEAAYELAPLEGFPALASQDRDWARSDHFNFDRNLEIPVAFLSAGEHPDYHQPSDTADKIDYDKLARITRLVIRMLDAVQDAPLERRQ